MDDGAEIKFGMDPHKKDSNGDGILDGDEKIDQTLVQAIASEEREQVTQVSVSMKATGDIQYSTKIENTYGKDVLSSGVVGLIGVPVNIESTSVFDEATITFTYDDTLLGETKEEDLRVMWYDEENNQYVIMDEETVLNTEQNTVSYTTTHFSTYLVVDRKAWYHVWSNALSYRRQPSNSSIPTEYFDICYVIDRSGSMSGTRIANAKMAIEGFVDAMYSNDRGAIVGFESYASVYSQFTSDKTILKNSLNSVYASGGTSVEAGLKAALDLFDATPNKVVNNCVNSKMILLLCDGDVTYTEVTLQRAVAKGIKIYPVLIGSTGGQASLQRFADLTGGKFYYAATAEEIRKSIFGIQEETIGDIDTTDTDGDGLYDIYETAGMIISNGQYIYSDPQKRDTDGDGLTDAKEMGVLENYEDQDYWKKLSLILSGFDNEVYAEYFDHTSNPNEKDSDNDTYNDDIDAKPFDYITERTYIFCEYGDEADWYLKAEASHRFLDLASQGKNTVLIPVHMTKDFINAWNTMGVDANGKVEFEISDVYTVFHGSPRSITIGQDYSNPIKDKRAEVFGYSELSNLSDKKIGTLHLSSCNNGNLDWLNAVTVGGIPFTQNMAISFMKQCPSIQTVKAWDGNAVYSYVFEYSVSGDSFNKWSRAKNGYERETNGLVTYTRLSSGGIDFDKKYRRKIVWEYDDWGHGFKDVISIKINEVIK